MVPNGSEILWKLQEDPEELTDEELASTSLSVLSKSLGIFTSRGVINAYLRWLEVQRKAPRRNINYHWLNTIAHWTQALRTRGFTLEEINREVSAWKAMNGPFVGASSPDSETRLPPTSANLAFGWYQAPAAAKVSSHNENIRHTTSDTMARRYDTQLERKLDCALTKVPASYVCNRCKGRGHYVSDCPTNENPAYDISAGYDYVCKFCKERGTHYFMFCPQNPDPSSIWKRRQDRAFQGLHFSPPCGTLGLEKNFASAPESPETPRLLKPSRSQIAIPKVSSPATEFDLFVNKRIGSRNEVTRGPGNGKGFDRLGIGKTGFAMGDTQDNNGAEENINPYVSCFETMGSSEGDIVWERRNDIQRKHSKSRLQGQPYSYLKQLVNEKTAGSTTASIINQSPHADFLGRLFAKHPSQRNPMWKPRMTALEMWDIHDAKKHQKELDEEMAKLSEREPSVDLKNSEYGQKNATHFSNSAREDSMDVDDDDYSKASEQDIDNLIGSQGYEDHEDHQEEQQNPPSREEKVGAIQTKIGSTEVLRFKYNADDDIDFPELKQVANGNLSQEKVNEISQRMHSPEPSSPSGLTSSSSELSSPPRLSSSANRTVRGGFHTN